MKNLTRILSLALIMTLIFTSFTFVKGYDFEIIDVSEINGPSNWAKQGVGVLANNNIMSGTSKTTLSPKSSATIEQSVLLVYRLYNIVSK
ncbi:MAG: hypothetical protein WDA24_01340 [Tissierellales bacterium]